MQINYCQRKKTVVIVDHCQLADGFCTTSTWVHESIKKSGPIGTTPNEFEWDLDGSITLNTSSQGVYFE